jgi:hypothetical protein
MTVVVYTNANMPKNIQMNESQAVVILALFHTLPRSLRCLTCKRQHMYIRQCSAQGCEEHFSVCHFEANRCWSCEQCDTQFCNRHRVGCSICKKTDWCLNDACIRRRGRQQLVQCVACKCYLHSECRAKKCIVGCPYFTGATGIFCENCVYKQKNLTICRHSGKSFCDVHCLECVLCGERQWSGTAKTYTICEQLDCVMIFTNNRNALLEEFRYIVYCARLVRATLWPKIQLGPLTMWRDVWRNEVATIAMALATLDLPVLQLLAIVDEMAPLLISRYTSDHKKVNVLVIVQKAFVAKRVQAS